MQPAYDPSVPPPLPNSEGNSRRGFLAKVGWFFDCLFGVLVILGSLAAISAIPVLHLFSLGYLLEASARVAKSGRIRDGFIGLQPAAWVGKIVVALWLMFLPIRILHGYWMDSQIIDAQSQVGKNLGVVIILVSTLAIMAALWAIVRGGKFRHFLWLAPIQFVRQLGQPVNWTGLRAKLARGKNSIHLLGLFRLGFFGFLGGAIWLALPVATLFLAPTIPVQPVSLLVSLIGAVMLGIVVLYLPFMQTQYAVTGRFSAFRGWKSVRERFRRAPLALWIALFVTLLFALPLYLLKIELAPQEVAWIPNLVFVLFMFPARLLVGWAVARSERRETTAHWFLRWTGRLGMLPAVIVYVIVVWLTQYLSWHGSYSLLEQHAFLLPAPMLGL